MNDKERLDLIEHYQWSVFYIDNGWLIKGMFGQLPNTYDTLRKAIDAALQVQAKWALGI